jgi:hypothetical protein
VEACIRDFTDATEPASRFANGRVNVQKAVQAIRTDQC